MEREYRVLPMLVESQRFRVVVYHSDGYQDDSTEFIGMHAKERAEHYAQIMNNPCIAKLKPGEPFFVLRGQDVLASPIVREWCDRASAIGVPADKLSEAYNKADAIRLWQPKKQPD